MCHIHAYIHVRTMYMYSTYSMLQALCTLRVQVQGTCKAEQEEASRDMFTHQNPHVHPYKVQSCKDYTCTFHYTVYMLYFLHTLYTCTVHVHCKCTQEALNCVQASELQSTTAMGEILPELMAL